MCDGRDDVSGTGAGVKSIVTIDTDRHAQVSASPCGCPLQRALSIGEGSAETWGKAPTAGTDLNGLTTAAVPSESAKAAFDGRRLSKVLLRYS